MRLSSVVPEVEIEEDLEWQWRYEYDCDMPGCHGDGQLYLSPDDAMAAYRGHLAAHASVGRLKVNSLFLPKRTDARSGDQK